MIPEVFSYSEPHVFVRDVLAHKQKKNALFSMRAWAKQMGFSSHTSLVHIVNGNRPIRPSHLESLNKGLRLEGDAEKYFQILVHRSHALSAKERLNFDEQLKNLVPSPEQYLLDIEKFKTVADWIHMAILEMTKLSDFQSDVNWIAARLKFNASVGQVQEAVERLLGLGLLEEKEGRWLKTQDRLTTPKDRSSESVREHHRQVLTNAIIAIEDQTVEERALNACTFTIDPSQLEEAKNLIRKFRLEMAKLLEKDQGTETYQLSVQLFKLTEKIDEKNEPGEEANL